MDEEKQKYTWEEKYKLDLVQENVEKVLMPPLKHFLGERGVGD